MSVFDQCGEFGDEISSIERRKQLALEEIAEMDKEIERIKAEKEQKRKDDIKSLFASAQGLIRTAGSSMTDHSIGEIYESALDQMFTSEEHMNTIDVELSGRYDSLDTGEVYNASRIDVLGRGDMANACLVVSYLIPFDMIEDHHFFKK